MAAVEITVPLKGKAQVRMTYAKDNRQWLHAAVKTRRPEWLRDEKVWLIPRSAAERVLEAATADGRTAHLTRFFRPDTEKCTQPCQDASPLTVSSCTCICAGRTHGCRQEGWKAVGDRLLIKPGEDGIQEQTVRNYS